MGELADKHYIGWKECPKCKGDMKFTIGGSFKCSQCGYYVIPKTKKEGKKGDKSEGVEK